MRNIVWIALAGALLTSACGDGPTSPSSPHAGNRAYPHWVEHTYYCKTPANVTYTVPPGHGTCDAGDLTVRVDPPIR